METRIAVKATNETRWSLRLISAFTGERQYQVLERLVRAELARVNTALARRGNEENKP